MRLFNFTIMTGHAAGDSSNSELVMTGTSGSADIVLQRWPNEQYIFSSNVGDDADDVPYGNINLHETSRVSTSAHLAVTQSLGAAMEETVKVGFVFVANGLHRG